MCSRLSFANSTIVILRQRSRARKRATPNEGTLYSLRSTRTDLGRDKKPGVPFLAFSARSGMHRDKNDYRGILTGLEGVSGKKAVDSDTMTVKN
jgi:hypothetical protein